MGVQPFKILISDALAKEGITVLEKEFDNFTVDVKTKHTPEQLKDFIGEYDGIIIRSATKLTADVLSKATNLKVIARAGTGYDNIDVEFCNKKGIIILITPMGNSNAVVELTLGLMIDWARNIARANSSMVCGKWEKKSFKGTELRGKTVAIIGLGRIGAGVAKRCQAFGMKTIGYDGYIPKYRAEELGVELFDKLEEMLPEADFVTLHVPMTDTTRNLISTPQFQLMKPNAVVINMARGGIVNEDALVKALSNKIIGGACIDVYSKEPATKEEFPFIGMDNVISTPHLGASTAEAQIEVAKMAARHLAQALNSQIFIDAVNVKSRLPEHLAEIYEPFMQLSKTLGQMGNSLADSPILKVEIYYRGEKFKSIDPIKASILFSIFKNRLSDEVTFMNLEAILAENKIDIVVEEETHYSNLVDLIKIKLNLENGKTIRVVGTVFSNQPKIIEINRHFMDISPSNYMLLMENTDAPGVIGKVGTLLGNLGVNIAGWQLGRERKGTGALSIITLDTPLTKDNIRQLYTIEEVNRVQFLNLE